MFFLISINSLSFPPPWAAVYKHSRKQNNGWIMEPEDMRFENWNIKLNMLIYLRQFGPSELSFLLLRGLEPVSASSAAKSKSLFTNFKTSLRRHVKKVHKKWKSIPSAQDGVISLYFLKFSSTLCPASEPALLFTAGMSGTFHNALTKLQMWILPLFNNPT